MVKLVGGSNRLAKLQAWIWLLASPLLVYRKRRAIQAMRKRSDSEILPLLSCAYLGGNSAAAAVVNWAVAASVRCFGLKLGH